MMRPIFVVVEGVDRVGKNTQADLLVERLRSAGRPAIRLTTPDYETATGRLVSEFLRGGAGLVASCDDSLVSEADEAVVLQSLLITNRYEVASRVAASLAQGQSVVCVRWWPSAVLYGREDGVGEEWVRASCSLLPEPDAYVLLDAEPSVFAGRLDPDNRYESSVSLQQRLAHAYREMWKEGRTAGGVVRHRWAAVDADLGQAEVAERVWDAVWTACPRLAGPR